MSPANGSEPGDSDFWDDDSGWSFVPDSAAELPLAKLTGRTLSGKYLIGDRLGTGGFSWVFCAKQLSTGQEVAVKVPRAAGEPAARLKRGGQLLTKLDHPYIANLIDRGDFTIDGVRLPFVVMQLVRDARPLSTFCREEPLNRPQKLDLFAKICDAVHSAHMIGVVHRDLKPGNILVDSRGEPKVIDFDIARLPAGLLTTAMAPQALTEGVVGTLRYMAPEQLDGAPVTAASDVFTMGAILQEIMTGEPPRQSVALGQVHEENLAHVPAAVKRIIRRCMTREPTKRYQDAGALAVAVRHCLKARGYVDPWWLMFCRAIAGTIQQWAAAIEKAADPSNVLRLVIVSLVFAALIWIPVGRRVERQSQKESEYRAAMSAAAATFNDDVSSPTIRRQHVWAAAASWRDWQSAELPLELVCMQNLLADAAPCTLPSDTRTVAIALSGQWLATATMGGWVTLAEAANPATPRARLPGLSRGDRVAVLTMGPRNRLAAGTVQGDGCLWDLDDADRSARPLARFDSIDGGIAAFDFSADGRRLAVISATGEIELWDIGEADEPRCTTTIPSVEASSVSPRSARLNRDGTRLFVAAVGGRLRVLTAATGAEVKTHEGLGPGRPTLVRSADASRLVSFVPGGRLRWHDPDTGRPLPESSFDPTGCKIALFTPDSRRLVVMRQRAAEGSTRDAIDVLAATGSGKTLRMEPLVSIATSKPIGTVAVGGGSRMAVEVAGRWQIWRGSSPSDEDEHSLTAMQTMIHAAAVNPATD